MQRGTRLRRRLDTNLHRRRRPSIQERMAINKQKEKWRSGLKIRIITRKPISTISRKHVSDIRVAERELLSFCDNLRVYLKRIAPGIRVSLCSNSV